MRAHVAPFFFALSIGCGRTSSGTQGKPAGSDSSGGLVVPSAASVQPSASAAKAPASSCGPLECRTFDDVAGAFQAATEGDPLVVAVGEAHPKKGFESIETSASRFRTEVVPKLEGRASDLLLELMAPAQGCEPATKATGKELKKIGENQAVEAPNEYVTLGKSAEKLHIRVSQLHPTCGELSKIAKSKTPALTVLEVITANMTRDASRVLLAPNHPEDKMFVIYGGAFHGEPDPPKERAEFSFAANLSKAAKGRYVSVHLFVREYIDASWDIWPWYPHFKPEAHPDKVTLFHPKPQHFVIITAAAKR